MIFTAWVVFIFQTHSYVNADTYSVTITLAMHDYKYSDNVSFFSCFIFIDFIENEQHNNEQHHHRFSRQSTILD